MKKVHLLLVLALALAGVGGVAAVAAANNGNNIGGGSFTERLSSYQETPALSTPGTGDFRAFVNAAGTELHWRLTFSSLESDATQAHIHFENVTNAGPVMVFLCSNLGNGPAGTQACPAAGGTISGVITANDVTAGAAAQGIAAGEFNEFVKALRSGATYVNVHSTTRPAGEIRAQLTRNGFFQH